MKKRTIEKIIFGIVFTALCLLISVPSASAKYPSKPIIIIVPWSAGGGGDITCRLLAQEMKKILGTPVLVKNLPGAGSLIGVQAMVDAKPDGYTLGFPGISAVIAQYTSVSPIMMDEYTPISGIINPSVTMWVNAKSPWKTFEEFVDYAKNSSKKIKNGTAGAGVIDHLYSTELSEKTGIRFNQIPYKGWAPAITALAGGHVDSVFAGFGPAKSMESAGKIRPLAIGSNNRHSSHPGLPTMKEGGVDITMPFWESLAVPVGTPTEIIIILDDAIRKSFDSPAFQKVNQKTVGVSYIGTKEIVKLRIKSNKQVKKLIEKVGLQNNR
jgi:tripartite-type tricarboxylate transporter receptor subunit TctC